MENRIEPGAFHKLTYGLFVLSAKTEKKDNACIINTMLQLTTEPNRISIAVNKKNYTHDMIMETKKFNVSVLTEEVPFEVFQQFGFHCGRDTDKFSDPAQYERTENDLCYIKEYTNAVFSGEVIQSIDCGTHTLFIADVVESKVLSKAPSVTYAYYFANIKPKPAAVEEAAGKQWVCQICNYVYDEGKESVKFEDLDSSWVCPLCKHPKTDFQ